MNQAIKRITGASVVAGFVTLSLLSCGAFDIDPVSDSVVNAKQTSDSVNTSMNVGDQAPVFNLKDGEGGLRSLTELHSDSAVLLIFYRGDWCPFCIDQLDSINAVLSDLSAKGVQVVAISPDEVSTVQNTERKFGQDFIFLSDEGSETIARYGIAKDEKLPHPAQFLIGQDGKIKWFYAGKDYKTRPTGTQLLKVVEKHL